MKEVKVSIHPTEIRTLKFENAMTAKPGEQMKIQLKTGTAVKLNPNSPTTAAVLVKFEALDENKNVQFEIETITGITVDSAIDHLDEIIKKNYMGPVLLAVNEKVRAAAMMVGLNITLPKMEFKFVDNGESIDATIFSTM